MIEKITLREVHAPYTITFNDKTFEDETLILQKEGQPVAIVLPVAEYEAYQAWRTRYKPSAQRQHRLAAFQKERKAFDQMLPALMQTYSGKVVAIYQGQVVEVGDEIGATGEKVYDRFGYVPCYVQRVENKQRVYKITSRRVIR